MNITIDNIKCLLAIQETGSITQAANKLYRAKSAVIYAIQSLENQLGFKVLDKSKYRPTLTPKGQEFLYCSKNLLNEYDQFIDQCKQIYSGVETQI